MVPTCQPVGTSLPGAPCVDWGDCVEGHLCVQGRCHALCCGGDWSACPEGQSCYRPFVVSLPGGPVESGASVCWPVGECSPLQPGSCPVGTQCHVVDSRGGLACVAGGEGAAGDPCPCTEGFTCVGDPGAGTCRRLCDATGGDPSCPLAEGHCVVFHRNPPGVGECTRL